MELDKHIKNNPLLYKSFLLALEIIKLYKFLTEEKHEYKTKDFHDKTKLDIKLGMNVEDKFLQPFLQKITK